MESDRDRIERLIEAFERSDWSEIDVRIGAVRVHLIAGGHAPTVGAYRAGADEPEELVASADEPATDHPPPPELPAGAHLVAAPSPGVFWRSPEPGAPPFVEVGDEVAADTTLCIIEVMKLMSHLKAGVAGRVVAIAAENGAAVAQDQPLVAIEERGG